jgi:glucose-6-phosphate isomerase
MTLQLKIEHADVDVQNATERLNSYTDRVREVRQSGSYEAAESSINLSSDEELLSKVKEVVGQKVTGALKYSLVVGIGGSNLGTKAVYDAVHGYGDVLEPNRFPKMLFAETTDPGWLVKASELLKTISSPEEIFITLISKSGGTTETVANYEILVRVLNEKFEGGVNDRVVVVTDEGSKLWGAATSRNIAHLPIPAQVGGRYSVLSAVGLVPLLSVGVDIEALRHGASEMLDRCLSGDDIALQSAAVLAAQKEKGCHINDNFFFRPELESVGKWYRQLMGESVGKEKSLSGETVHAGLTPTVSLGSTDLHSVGQLYLGGPKDKITTFVSTAQFEDVSVPSDRQLPELVPMVAGKSAGDIMTAILEGVKIAYGKQSLPFMEVVLDTIDLPSIGGYLQFKMLEMMYLGQLFNVNSFDQPNVESYKIETKQILESK